MSPYPVAVFFRCAYIFTVSQLENREAGPGMTHTANPSPHPEPQNTASGLKFTSTITSLYMLRLFFRLYNILLDSPLSITIMIRPRLHNVTLTSRQARQTRPTPSHGSKDSGNFYYFQNQRWYCPQNTREEAREAHKHHHFAIVASTQADLMARKKPAWQDRMRSESWPQSLERFGDLPMEVKVLVIRMAMKEAIEDRVNGEMWKYDLAAWRNLKTCCRVIHHTPKIDHYACLQRQVEVMKRHELLQRSCLGSLLSTSRLFRDEIIYWLEARKVRGEEWGKGKEVRRGTGQVVVTGWDEVEIKGSRKSRGERRRWKQSWDLDHKIFDGKQHIMEHGGWVVESSGKRKDVRRWLGAVYYFQRRRNQDTMRIEILD